MRHLPAPLFMTVAAFFLLSLPVTWPGSQMTGVQPAAAQAQNEDPGIEIGPDPDAPTPEAKPSGEAPPAVKAPAAPKAPGTPSPPAAPEAERTRDLESRVDKAKSEADRAAALAAEAARQAGAKAEAEMTRERVIRRRVQDRSGDGDGQIVRMGQDVVIESGEMVEEVVVIGGDLTVRGEVSGDAVAVGGDLRVEDGGLVGGDAVSIGGDLEVDEGGVVNGDEVQVANMGPIILPGLSFGHDDGPGVLARIMKNVLKLLAILFIGWLAMVLFGHRLAGLADIIQSDFWRSLLVGMLVLVFWLPAVFLSAITIIGIPVAILLVLAVPFALLVGYLIGALAFGRRLVAGIRLHHQGSMAHLLIGLAAIGLLILFGQVLGIADVLGPVAWAFKFAGWTLLSFASILGTGALVMRQMDYLRARRSGREAVPPVSDSPPPPPSSGPETGPSEGSSTYRGKLVWENPPPSGEASAGSAEPA